MKAPNKAFIGQNKYQLLGAIAIEVVPLVSHEMLGRLKSIEIFDVFTSPIIATEAYQYIENKSDKIESAKKEASSIVNNAIQITAQMREDITSLREEAVKTNKFLKDSLSSQEVQVSNFTAATKVNLNTVEADAKSSIEAIRSYAQESTELKAATAIWHKKSQIHQFTFWCGLAFLGFCIISSLWIMLQNHKTIFDAIPKKADQDIAYGTILLILIPIVAVGWLLKIIGKLVGSASALGEDAQQREAMLETYLRLVRDPNSGMQQGDRLLVLNAIFRPLPGQGPEEISPPTLGDLVKDILNPKK